MDKEKKNKVINFKNFIKSKKNNKNFNNNNNIVKNTNDDLLINEERKGNLKEKGQNNINLFSYTHLTLPTICSV